MSRALRRRNFALTVTVLVVLGLLAAAVLLRLQAAPEPARLLPECDGVLYANLKLIRSAVNLERKPEEMAPEYREFFEQTGFEFERDLDQLALAIHAPQGSQNETRYSEVMVGRFDSAKLRAFLKRMAKSSESYHGHEIYLIPYEDRIVRVSVLSVDVVAVSNTGEPAHIDHIIDEFRHPVFGAGGPHLLEQYYRKVPFSSPVWFITQIAPPAAISLGAGISPLPFVRQLLGGGVLVGSARYNGNLLIKLEDFLKDESAARDRAEQLQNLLSLYRATDNQTQPEHPDADLESALKSLTVAQKGERVQVNASVPVALFKELFESPTEAEPEPKPPAPSTKNRRHRRKHQ